MKGPDFIIVGAQKCATTWLADSLAQNPLVDVSVPKEPNFHVKASLSTGPLRVVTCRDTYTELWKSNDPATLKGEASVMYLACYEEAISSILEYEGKDIKIIICLREPISRLLSAYKHSRRSSSDERLNLQDALAARDSRRNDSTISPSLNYLDLSLYSEAVDRFQNSFNHVLVLSYDDIMTTPNTVLCSVDDFLGLSHATTAARASNVGTGFWRYSFLESALKSAPVLALRRLLRFRTGGVYMKIRSAVYKFGMSEKGINYTLDQCSLNLIKDDLVKLKKIVNIDVDPWLEKLVEKSSAEK